MFVEGIVDCSTGDAYSCSTGDAYSNINDMFMTKKCNQLRLGSIWAPSEHKFIRIRRPCLQPNKKRINSKVLMFVEGIVDTCSTGDAYSKYQWHVYDKKCNQLRLGSIWAPSEHKSSLCLFFALNAHMWLRLFSAIIIFTGFLFFFEYTTHNGSNCMGFSV